MREGAAELVGGFLPLRGVELILASSSPRRRELLAHLGLPFTVIVPATEERRNSDESVPAYIRRNAREKALAALSLAQKVSSALVIGSDTVGLFRDDLLEKPIDSEDAKRMLRLLSGQTHEVLTAIAVVRRSGSQDRIWEDLVRTNVRFKKLQPEEIDYYVQTGEPLDKAGSYGIQGVGGFMVEAIEGSYSNVVGLPLVELTRLLQMLFKSPIEVSEICS